MRRPEFSLARDLFSQARGGRRRPLRMLTRKRPGSTAPGGAEALEARRLMAFDLVAAYAQSTTPFYVSGAVGPITLDQAPQQITLRFSPGVTIDASTLDSISVLRSGGAGDGFGTKGSLGDVTVPIGSITVDDVPNQNQVVVRFAEPLVDDDYRITITDDLKATAGSAPVDFAQPERSIDLRLDLGAHVVSVVPQPVIRSKTITVGSLPADGDRLEVAIRGRRMVLEFDSNNTPVDTTATRVAFTATDTPTVLAGRIRDALFPAGSPAAVFGSELLANTDPAGPLVTLSGRSFTPVVAATKNDGTAAAAAVLAIGDGSLTHLRDAVVVHFNANDPLDPVSATLPANYQLFETDASTGASLLVSTPTTVSYDAVSGSAVLSFAPGVVADGRLYRLQIGNSADANNTLAAATDLGTIFTQPGGGAAFSTVARLGDDPTTAANDVDLYKLRLTAAGQFTVTVTPQAGLDTILRLFDAAGAPITTGVTVTGGGAGVARTLSFTAAAAGTFLVGVSSSGNAAYSAVDGSGATGGAATGSYALAVSSNVAAPNSDDNSSFGTASSLGTLGAAGALVASTIDNRLNVPTPVGSLPFPQPFGSLDSVGHRDIPVNDGVENHGIPGVGGAGTAPAIQEIFYNFKSVYGQDPQGNDLFNAITETQKVRAREVFELFSRFAGVRFTETDAQGITVVTGDMRAIDPNISTAPAGLAGNGLAIMDSTEDWGDSEYGGAWFQTAMHEIGHCLGLLHSYDLPTIMGAGEAPADGLLPTEPVFPGNYDIEHLLQLFPKSGTDIDVYSFQLDSDGFFTAETIVARPGQAVLSTLDTVLSLYREVTVNATTSRELVARNDDAFGRDSFLSLDLRKTDEFGNPYTYYVAVTSTGNTAFNPAIENSGSGGSTEGAYQLRLGFAAVTPTAAASTILDTDGTQFDGDRDGIAGGKFDFAFRTASIDATVYVDKLATALATTGSFASNATTVTVTSTAGLAVGMKVVGSGITAGTRVTAIDTVTRVVTLSSPTTRAGTNASLTFGGTLARPFATISTGLAAASSAGLVRILGNDGNAASPSDDRPYLIGRAQGQSGAVLADGSSFTVPANVTVVIDEGAVLKLRGAAIDVGSSSQQTTASRAGAALQVLGTPSRSVRFTSYHDDAWGGDSDLAGPAAGGGQWGGIIFRQDSDAVSKRSFVNTVSNAELRFGGGQVMIDSKLQTIAPIHLVSTRPTIAFNRITQSAGAAISADPNSFDETGGRIGPELRGNLLGEQGNPALDNSINGVFIRIETQAGSALTKLTVPARFKSTDVVYVIAENLVIDGGVGGYLQTGGVDTARATGRLTIDPGVVVKLVGSRIELERGTSRLYAEGLPGNRVIFTSLADNRFGAGGTFDTNGNQNFQPQSGNWGGIVLNAGAGASVDNAYVGFAGGVTPIEGGFAAFNVFEVHQADLRLANSRIEHGGTGYSPSAGMRTGRGTNAAATIFARGSQPIVVGNDFRENLGALVSVNVNALDDRLHGDVGRATGEIARVSGYDDNFGPLVRDNTISYTVDDAAGRPAGGAAAGMVVRGEEITVEGVWDDTDIVHVLNDAVVVRNFHTATGLRLVSKSNASLVIKAFGADAGLTASGVAIEIDDRIGGTVQVLGQPGYPVVMTSVRDDSVYASLDPLGRPVRDTNTDGTATAPAPGDWRGLRFLELSNDRNVTVLGEAELAYTSRVDVNGDLGSSQPLGLLAPNFASTNTQGSMNSWESAQEKSGDENRRLGFEVHGTIALDDPTDVDLYGFQGYAGSEVWLDIDKTSGGLDTMVELLDADGNVLACSVDALNDIGVVRIGNPNVVAGTGTNTNRTYQLPNGNILPGTLTGVLYRGNTAIQTFTFNRAGGVTFTAIGFPAVRATAAVLDRTTGSVALTFDGDPGATTRIEVGYEFARLPLDVLGFAANGDFGAFALTKDAFRGNDHYTLNPRDPGMRVILPGATGDLSQYFIRVRSQPAYSGGTSAAQYASDLADSSLVDSAGATSGRYELRVRLRQQDEKPGSTVRYADIRYPVTGIEVIGLPRNSPLVGENGEDRTDANDSFVAAQPLGNLLATDRNTISLAGLMAGESDVDWYSFTVDYDLIQAIPGVNGGGKTWSTMFDIDYADGFRGDLTLSVFDAQGRLIFVSRDSNVADDQPGPGQGNDFDDLSRGSLGKLDPFIGPVQLPAGVPGQTTRYFVAVSSNERLPSAINATFTSGAANPFIRLEPVNSVTRIVEDHIGSTGYTSNGASVAPTTGAIINVAATTATGSTLPLSSNIRAFSLADVTLFVTNGFGVYTADAFRGGIETVLNEGYTAIGDIDMRPDGRLYAYEGLPGDGGNVGRVMELDTGTGGAIAVTSDGIADKDATTPLNYQTNSDTVLAMAFRRMDIGRYDDAAIGGLWLVLRSGGRSKLYKAASGGTAAAGGANAAANQAFDDANGLGYRGNIQIAGVDVLVTGIQFVQDSFGTGSMVGVTSDGRFITIPSGTKSGADDTPEYSFDATVRADFATQLAAVGATGFAGLANAPQNLQDNAFRGMFFAITNNGRLVCINPTTNTLVPLVFDTNNDGVADSDISNVMVSNPTGLAFSPLDINLWHPTVTRGGDQGHGVNGVGDSNGNTIPDFTRSASGGGASMYFGLEQYVDDSSGSYRTGDFNPGGGNGQFGVRSGGVYNWQQELTANPAIARNYNLPGGAYGSLITNPFSLASYVYTDKPTLYFNYFLDTQNASAGAGNASDMRDSARVFISTDDGLTWSVLATNNQARSDQDTTNAELPTVLSTSSAIGTGGNQHVQELFDSTGTWRQARVDLGKWAGESNIRLRFDFSTAGEMDAAQRRTTADITQTVQGAVTNSTKLIVSSLQGLRNGMVVTGTGIGNTTSVAPFTPVTMTITNTTTREITLSAPVTVSNNTMLSFFDTANRLLNTIAGPAGSYGAFTNAQRGQNNAFEGFYIDDIIVGFAERGEMVTDASTGQTDFFAIGTPTSKNYPEQTLEGPYQLEIRRGTEFGTQKSGPEVTIGQTFDTNDRFVRSPAVPSLELEVNDIDALQANVLADFGSGNVTFPSAALLGQAGIAPVAGTTLAVLESTANGSLRTNLLAWSIDLANQPSAFLEFAYAVLPREVLTPLPPTFATPDLPGGDKILPAGDGVAVSTDGGKNWTTIASYGGLGSGYTTAQINLVDAVGGLSANTVVGFFQSGDRVAIDLFNPNLATAGGVLIDAVRVLTAPPIATSGLVGDSNFLREQGQFLIESNIISDASQYGINVDAGNRTTGSNAPHPGVARNLPTLNNQRLVPGAVIFNNIIAASGLAGVRFSGQTNADDLPPAVVPFGRLVNNTFSGPTDGSASGVGVEVTDSASPTLLNNLFANLGVGVNVDGGSAAAGTVVAYSAYWQTANRVSGVVENDALVLASDPFVNAATRNYYIAPGSAVIDSGIDGLQDRNQSVVLKNAVDIPPSPIIAPALDLYGQLRLDDPTSAGGAPGLGYNVFKDRGAVERADFTQPTASILEPLDGSTSDRIPAADRVRVELSAARGMTQLVLQLADTGIGIDDATVDASKFTVVYRPLVGTGTYTTLVDGVDYVFQYLENTKTVVFQSPAVFPMGDYKIVVDNTAATGIRDLAGNPLLNNDVDGVGTTAFQVSLIDLPDAPGGVQGTVLPQAVTIQWVAPTSHTGATLTGFYVEHSLDGVTWTRSARISLTATSHTVTGLVNGTTYRFRVAAENDSGIDAENGIGVGPFSAPILVTPLATPGIALQSDTGLSTTDGVTTSGVVTVSGLQAGTGAFWEFRYGSIDWTVGVGSSFTLPVGTYPQGTVEVRQTFPTGNTSQVGSNAIAFVIDQTAPAAPTLALGTGVTEIVSENEAIKATGVVAVTGEANARITVEFILDGNTANKVTKIVTGTGSAQGVVLTLADLETLGGPTGFVGVVTVTAVQLDLAGNPQVDPPATMQFAIDTIPPSTIADLRIRSDISDPVSATEAIRATGLVETAGDAGNLVVVIFTGPSGTVTKTITLSSTAFHPVVLDTTERDSLGNGLVTVTATQTDPAGNPQADPPIEVSFTLDLIAPTVAITSSKAQLKAGDTALITFALSEDATDFILADVSVSGGMLTNFAGSGRTYTATFVPAVSSTASGTISIAVGAFTDAAGNENVANALNPAIAIDTVIPTIAITSTASSLKAGQRATIGFVLSESSTNFVLADVTVSGGQLTNFSGSGRNYSALFTPTVDSTAPGVISVAANAFTDAFGNGNVAGDLSPSIVIDTALPSVFITSNTDQLKGGETATITFELSEDATDFVLADITVAGGVLSGFSGSAALYTAVFTPFVDSMVTGTITVAAGVFTDAIGNPNTAAALAPPIAIDTIRPTVAITSTAAQLKAGEVATISFTLSENALDFDVADVTTAGGTLSNFRGSGAAYFATFTPAEDSTTPGSIRVAAGKFTDAFGNDNVAGALAPPIAIDTVIPSITITASKPQLKAGETADVTFTLSEPSTTFTATDVAVTGGTLSGFSGTGAVYTAVFTPLANSTVTGVLSVGTGAFTDAFGNGNRLGARLELPIDTILPVAPVLVLGPGVANGGTAAEVGQAAVIVTGEVGATIRVEFVNGTRSVVKTLTGTGAAQSVALSVAEMGQLGEGRITVSATQIDSFGNPQSGAAVSVQFTLDTVLPTVLSISSTAGNLRVGQTAVISFTLSEPTSNFTVGDVAVAGGTLSNFTGSGTNYSATFTPALNFTGLGTVTVADSAFTDAAGNGNVAAALTPAIGIDTHAPFVSRFATTTANGTYDIGATITLVATLSETVQPGGSFDVRLNSGAVVRLTESGPNQLTGQYVIQPGEVADDLDVIAITPSSTIRDLVGNPMTSSVLPATTDSLAQNHDIRVAGAVRVIRAGSLGSSPTAIPTFPISMVRIKIEFSTEVTGIAAANSKPNLNAFRLLLNGRSVSLRNARLVGSGSTYELILPPSLTSARGTYTLEIGRNSLVKATANGAVMTQPSIFYWRKGPVASSARAAAFSQLP